MQTQYRDSEAQTDPYSPEYSPLNLANPPEVVSLAHLTWANGRLPASDREIDRVLRDRERRRAQASLPPISDKKTLELHRMCLEEQEKLDFALCEREIDEDMEGRLAEIRADLERRNTEDEGVLEQRIKVFRQEKMGASAKELGCIQKKRERSTLRRQSDHQAAGFSAYDCIPLPSNNSGKEASGTVSWPQQKRDDLDQQKILQLKNMDISEGRTNRNKAKVRLSKASSTNGYSFAAERQAHVIAADLELIDGIFKKEDDARLAERMAIDNSN